MPLFAPSSFTTPDPYGAEQQSIETQRRLALALQAQGAQPMEQPSMAGQMFTPHASPFAGLARMLQSYGGRKGQETADMRERALAEEYQSNLGSTIAAAQGAPNRQKMIEALMGHPITRPIALQQMNQDLESQGFMQAGGLGGTAPAAASAAPAPAAIPGQGPAPATPTMPAGVPPQAFGQPAGGSPLAVWLRSDPTGKSYLEALAKEYAPISTRYGIFQKQPDGSIKAVAGALPQGALSYQPGGGAGLLPGQAEASAQLAGAEGAGKAPYQNVTTGGGASGPAYLMPGYKPPPMPGQPSPAPAAAPAPLSATPPAAAPQRNIQWQQVGPPGTSAEQAATGEAMKASEAGLPYSKVVDQGGAGDPWQTMPRRAQPQGFGQTTFDKSMAEHQAGTATELATKYGTQSDAANQRIALNNQALSLVDKADTGPLAAQTGVVKNWLVSNFGVPEADFKNTPSATYALQKDLLNAATQKAKAQFGARMTQQEVLLMLSKGAPNVDMPKAAIKYLIGSDNAVSQYQIKQANDFGRYMQSGGDPQRFESWYSQSFPLTGTLGGVHMGGNEVKDIVASGQKPSAQEIADEMRRRGLIK